MTKLLPIFPISAEKNIEEPWVVWRKMPFAASLQDKEETDGRHECEHIDGAFAHEEHNARTVSSNFSRQQYFSVLNRMNQASGKAGTFSNWNS